MQDLEKKKKNSSKESHIQQNDPVEMREKYFFTHTHTHTLGHHS